MHQTVHRTVVEGTPGAVKRGTLNAVQVRQLKAERCSECMQLVPPRSEGMEQMLAADARSYCRHRRSIVWQQEGEPPMCCALAAVLPRASRGIRPPPVYIALRFKPAKTCHPYCLMGQGVRDSATLGVRSRSRVSRVHVPRPRRTARVSSLSRYLLPLVSPRAETPNSVHIFSAK